MDRYRDTLDQLDQLKIDGILEDFRKMTPQPSKRKQRDFILDTFKYCSPEVQSQVERYLTNMGF
jgi:hypothetical protein